MNLSGEAHVTPSISSWNGGSPIGPSSLTLPDGVDSISAAYTFPDNSIVDGDKYYNVSLSGDVGGISIDNWWGPSISVADNDSSWSFSADSIVTEGNYLYLNITRSGSTANSGTVDVSFTGPDNTLSGTASVYFGAGSTYGSLWYSIPDDSEVQGSRTYNYTATGGMEFNYQSLGSGSITVADKQCQWHRSF